MEEFKKETAEEVAANEAAKNEQHFECEQLLSEIKPLIEDYFVGKFELDSKGLVCKFLNGQVFRITAEEIK